MIRVIIEKHSANDGRREILGVMDICNDGTGTPTIGSYDGKIYRKGTWRRRLIPLRHGRVNEWPREALDIWMLVARMLCDIFPQVVERAIKAGKAVQK